MFRTLALRRSLSMPAFGMAALMLAPVAALPAHAREGQTRIEKHSERQQRGERRARQKPQKPREARREARENRNSFRQERRRASRDARSDRRDARSSRRDARTSRRDARISQRDERSSRRDARAQQRRSNHRSDHKIRARSERHRGDRYSSGHRYDTRRGRDYDRRHRDRRYEDRKYRHKRGHKYGHGRKYGHGHKYGHGYGHDRRYRHDYGRGYGHGHRYSDRYDRRHRRHGYDRYRARPWYDCDYRDGIYIRYGGYRNRHFDIPKVIVTHGSHDYGDYYYERVYDASHGHYHEVYLFPVYHYDRVEYRPYLYCEGKLYGRARFDAWGGLSIDLNFSF